MCGICGAIAINGEIHPGVRAALPAMTRALRHRGPDGTGLFQNRTACLGHRRLSIIDRAGGAQPMSNEDGSVQIVFNGEIYNHKALRQILVSRGHIFRTASDTETIVHGYEEYGEAIVERLDGMFAFAVYDARRRRLLLARDRVGKKPLFYAELNGVLHFASEIKSLRASPFWNDTLDPAALESYLSLGYILAPRTIYRDVRKLLPGHVLTLSDGAVRTTRFWDVEEFDSERGPEHEVITSLDEALRTAVRDRLESEVPLGAFLSGGIDSGLVVSYMAEALPSVMTTSVGFGDRAHNELDAAAISAAHLGTRHYPEQVEPRLSDILDSIAGSFDEPFADSSAVPTSYVSQLTRTHVTVALSGDGGDEVFGGYGFRYVPHLVENRARGIIRAVGAGPLVTAAGRAWPRGQRVPKPFRLGTFLENAGSSAAEAYYADLCFLKPRSTNLLLGLPERADHRNREPFAMVTGIYERCGSPDPVQRAQYTDLHVYLPNDVLVKVDRMSMLHSLEVRCPLLDHRVIEMAFRLPRTLKLKGLEPKHLLRELARRRLPAKLLKLPKHGFTAPVGRWVTEHAATLREHVLGNQAAAAGLIDLDVARRWLAAHVRGEADHSYPLWALWMLQAWSDGCRSGGVSNTGQAVTEVFTGELCQHEG